MDKDHAMLDGMRRLDAMKAEAGRSGRKWAYAAVTRDGLAFMIYADGEMDGLEAGVVLNRIPALLNEAVSRAEM